ncbi:MAG: recombinase family protein [Verrucomicrobiia bacterium]
MTPRVYSYTRFSSPEQALGDSERRQIEAAQRYADEHGMVLDKELRMIDRGLSGFHGTHRKKGAFGEFLRKVETGEVPRGSILLVENTDRLSREPIMTILVDIVGKLLKHGVTIQTLSPPDTFTLESVNNGGIWRLVAYGQMGHAESEKKSERIKASWARKRKDASERILTGRGPAWLRVQNDQWHVIPEAADTIRLIYKLKLEGFGKGVIEKKLNQQATWTPPGRNGKASGWRASYIEKILRNRAVMGEFQPHRRERKVLDDGEEKRVRLPEGDPIADYFPCVVEPKLFYAVQRKMKAAAAIDGNGGGRTGKAMNVFQNLVKCAYCGGPMVFIDKGRTLKGGRYLVCDTGRRGVKDEQGNPKCAAHSVRYDEFEGTLLDNLTKLKPDRVLPNPKEQADQAKELQASIAGLAGEVADVTARVGTLLDQIERTPDPVFRARYEQRAADLESKKATLTADMARQEAGLRELERSSVDFAKWQKDLAELKKAITEGADNRIRLKAHLQEFIDRIEVFAKGHEDTVDHCLALVEEYMPELEQSASYSAFIRYLRQRCVSSEGRFYRLHLKRSRPVMPGYKGIALAPADSMAYRMEMKGKERTHEGPALKLLLEDFFDGRKPGFVPKASRVNRR